MADLTDATIKSLTKAELICLINTIEHRCMFAILPSDILRARHAATQDAADRAFNDWKDAVQARNTARGEAIAASNLFAATVKMGKAITALRKLDVTARKAEDAFRAADHKVDQLWNSYLRNSDKASRLYEDAETAREKEFRA